LGIKNFAREVATGFGLDLIFLLSLFFLQGVNNSTLAPEHELQSKTFFWDDFKQTCLVLKTLALLDWVLEFLMFLVEVYRLNHLDTQSVDVIVRFSEEKRR
jgi:hypothetical protein